MAEYTERVTRPENSQILDAALRPGLRALESEGAEEWAEPLLKYLSLLQRWNRTHNLTAIRNPTDMVTLHLLDSLSVLPHLAESRIADLGCGAGLPGIPLAIARPELQVTLIESNGKKCSFMRAAKRELGLENIEIVQTRGEDFHPAEPPSAVISRAFSSLQDFWRIASPLLSGQGRLLAMKGRLPTDELAALPESVVRRVMPLSVPGLDAERCLIELSLPAAH